MAWPASSGTCSPASPTTGPRRWPLHLSLSSTNVPRLKNPSRNSALLSWARQGSPLRALLIISVGIITGLLVFKFFFVIATFNIVIISAFMSLAAAGGFLAFFCVYNCNLCRSIISCGLCYLNCCCIDNICDHDSYRRDVQFDEEGTWDWKAKDEEEDEEIVKFGGPTSSTSLTSPLSPTQDNERPQKSRNTNEFYDVTNELHFVCLLTESKPIHFEEAIVNEQWKETMDEEIKSIENKIHVSYSLPKEHVAIE